MAKRDGIKQMHMAAYQMRMAAGRAANNDKRGHLLERTHKVELLTTSAGKWYYGIQIV